MTLRDSEGDEERARFVELLGEAEARSLKLHFWWRDDDAETVTPELDALLTLAGRHAIPLGLAVIPKGATATLANRLASEAGVSVLQHGWQHRRNSPATDKKMELGDHRPLSETTRELRLGFERLQALFPNQFLPVLVPPWNRIGKAVNAARGELGLTGLSTFGQKRSDDPNLVNTHLDIFDWQGPRGPLPRARAYAILCGETARRLSGDPEPIGILTHHLIHQPESWAFLDELFSLLAKHPAVEWPPIAKLFALPPP